MGDSMLFQNIFENNMTFDQVFFRILQFIEADQSASYRLSIGTDSHVHHNETRFISAIHIHRIGKGTWGCLKKVIVPREVRSIHEKISMETAYSQEIAWMFSNYHFDKMTGSLLTYSVGSADFQFEIHLDIGKKGLTKELIKEMTGRINSMGIEARIKPDSYTASSYANRYTK